MKTVSDLQRSIFFCIENYDNWRLIPVIYQKDISKDGNENIVFEANIDDLDYYDNNLNFTSSRGAEEQTICLESLSELIDEMVDCDTFWFQKVLKFKAEMEIEFETTENVMVRTRDFDYIKDFFVNEECFILIGE